jgi:hypothetical protein
MLELETELFKLANKKIIILPYGSDAYVYDKVINLSLRKALLISYPESGRAASEISNRINHFSKNADIIIPGFMCELFPYWSVTTCSPLVIDTNYWLAKNIKTKNDSQAQINILHTPNHRGFKGTEFIVSACNKLKSEGFKINLLLIERKQNNEVKDIMHNEADILVDQLIADGYALSATEGMASGLPVVGNLSDLNLMTLFRRYSYLNECPIVSSTPETIYNILKILIENPSLRIELGAAGQKYVEKYHSYEAGQYMFSKIYDTFNGSNQNLSTLFHPIIGEYNCSIPNVKHPLVNNLIPA